MKLKFWGTRGSIPIPGNSTLKYGGNTPCVELRTQNDELIILDAGSGIRELGNYLADEGDLKDINLLLSHYHWDHIQGLPFFIPIYQKNRKIIIHGLSSNGDDVEKILRTQMTPNYFPISLEETDADISYKKLSFNKKFTINNLEIETFVVNHPSPALTFKITEGQRVIVYMTDNEIHLDNGGNEDLSEFNTLNKELIEFCRGCDYLIHDTMYDEEAVRDKKGWGHSSNRSLAYFSIIAEVKHLVFFHYNPDHSDDRIDLLIDETTAIFKANNSQIECIGAREGLEIELLNEKSSA